jgi:hypothetical protein
MWRDIRGFEDRYQINEDGEIQNKKSQKILSPTIDSDGYKQIGIRHIGVRKKSWFRIHRLVAIAFIETPINFEELHVDHIDRNKINNSPSNLRWSTLQENCNNRKQTCWKTNITSGELHITQYRNGFMLRINKHNLKHRSWHKTLVDAINVKSSLIPSPTP